MSESPASVSSEEAASEAAPEASPVGAPPEVSDSPAAAEEDAEGDPGASDAAKQPRSAREAGEGPRWLPWLAAVVALVSLLLPIGWAGIWEPPELLRADQARRIALNVMGATGLELEGANNAVPTLGELSRGELPLTSMALGFKLFGLHEWAGRLPLALWALVGVAMTYLLVRRLMGRQAAALSALVLCTTPMYFLHARTMLGDAVTFAAVALAVSGLGLAVFDRRATRGLQVGWLVLGLLGVAAGFGSRGALLGVSVPCLAVGLAWVLSGVTRSRSWFGALTGALALTLGLVALWVGLKALARADTAHYSIWLGAQVEVARQRPTFDAVIRQLGHGALPWSAVFPIALAQLFIWRRGAQGDAEGAERDAPSDTARAEGELGLRLMLVLCAALAFAAHATMAPVTGELPFVALFALAAIIGVGLGAASRDFPGSLAAGVVAVALAVVFYTDFKNFPEKGFTAYATSGGQFPESFKETATRLIKYGLTASAALFALLYFERGKGRAFDRQPYAEYAGWLRGTTRHFSVLLLGTAAVAFAVLSELSARWLQLPPIEGLSSSLRGVLSRAWLMMLALAIAPFALMAAIDAARFVTERLRVGRLMLAGASLAGFGLVLSLGYYPALAAQVSPKEVFEAYARLAGPGEELAVVEQEAGSASYYAGVQVVNHPNMNVAGRWLQTDTARRWLVIRSADLPQLNAKHREQHKQNLPVLNARSSEILLVSNRLAPDETNQNPFQSWLLDAPREPQVLVGADLDQLVNLGWEVTDLEGRPVPTEEVDGRAWPVVRPQVEYRFAIHWRVKRAITGNWKTFIHIDGHRRRYNGDHDTLEGKYPVHLWRPDDQVVDYHTIRLEPHFSRGHYEVLYGLYIGDRRLEVRQGAHDKNRIRAGWLIVR
ncbi:MAG: glycosyltransferase family 39 protein [Polyangiaceae bacterium]|nr:glycosyltransferase family 39 protein [Polyangiaceae bacterium]MCW5790802.1 glycosyltransferase family 39 protein [Polyangiaceae bacterium]